MQVMHGSLSYNYLRFTKTGIEQNKTNTPSTV